MDDLSVYEGTKNRSTTRATPGQLAILRNAYEQSVAPSFHQKKSLSEQTGLPPRWIGQWFCRQRNRNRPGGANDKGMFVTAKISSAPTPEPVHATASVASFSRDLAVDIFQEGMDIKPECLDSAFSSSPGNGVSMDPIMVGSAFGTSMLIDSGRVDRDDGIADSTKEKTKPVASQKRKSALSKARAKITFETARTQAGMTEVPTLTECANLRGLGETINDLDLPAFLANRHLAGTTSANAYTQRPPAQEQSASIVKFQDACLTSTAPPRRSSTSTYKAAASNRPSRLPVVSMPVDDAKVPSESYQHDLSLAPSHMVPSSWQLRSRLVQDTVASYQRGHTQWQSNRPGVLSRLSQEITAQNKVEISAQIADAMISIPDSLIPTASFSSRVPPVVQPLVLANTDSSALLMTYLDISSSLLKEGDPSSDMGLQAEIMKSNIQQRENENYPEISESNLYELLDVLDPSRAPLKHLTGVLADFRSEDGSYWSLLVDAEIRSKLVDCLANEELSLENPFVGAMGLSLLSRLGLL